MCDQWSSTPAHDEQTLVKMKIGQVRHRDDQEWNSNTKQVSLSLLGTILWKSIRCYSDIQKINKSMVVVVLSDVQPNTSQRAAVYCHRKFQWMYLLSIRDVLKANTSLLSEESSSSATGMYSLIHSQRWIKDERLALHCLESGCMIPQDSFWNLRYPSGFRKCLDRWWCKPQYNGWPYCQSRWGDCKIGSLSTCEVEPLEVFGIILIDPHIHLQTFKSTFWNWICSETFHYSLTYFTLAMVDFVSLIHLNKWICSGARLHNSYTTTSKSSRLHLTSFFLILYQIDKNNAYSCNFHRFCALSFFLLASNIRVHLCG